MLSTARSTRRSPFFTLIVYFLMIIGFSYFYATIQFNPVEISNNLKQNGGFIPGFRPGKPTSDYCQGSQQGHAFRRAILPGIVHSAPLVVGKLATNNASASIIGGTSASSLSVLLLKTVQALSPRG